MDFKTTQQLVRSYRGKGVNERFVIPSYIRLVFCLQAIRNGIFIHSAGNMSYDILRCHKFYEVYQ